MQPVFALFTGGGGAIPAGGVVSMTPESGTGFADILAEEDGAGALSATMDVLAAEPSVEPEVVEPLLGTVPTYWPQVPAVDSHPLVATTGSAPLPGGDVSVPEDASAEADSPILEAEAGNSAAPVAQQTTDASAGSDPTPAIVLPTSAFLDQRGVADDVPHLSEGVPAQGKLAAYALTQDTATPRQEGMQSAANSEATLAAPRFMQAEAGSGPKAHPAASDQSAMRQVAHPPAFLRADPPPEARGRALGLVPAPAAGLSPGLDATGVPPLRAAPAVALAAAVTSPVEEAQPVVENVVAEGESEALPAPPVFVSAVPVTFAMTPPVASDGASLLVAPTLLAQPVGPATVREAMLLNEMPAAAQKNSPVPPDILANAPAIPSSAPTLMPALPAWLELATLEQHEQAAELLVSGPSALGPTSAASAGVAVPSSAPTPLAMQVLAGLSRHQDGTTEITLSPEELGTIRLRLRPDSRDSERMVVTLSFDRPETMELFRRHADQLAEAIRSSGYAGVDIGFDRGGDRSQGFSGTQRLADVDPTEPSPGPTDPQPRLLAGAALDLRL